VTSGDDGVLRTVIVAGEGNAGAVPDRCVIAVSLRVQRDTVANAVNDVAALADAAMSALRAAGVAAADLQTVNLAVHDWFDPQGQHVTAQVAMYMFTVTCRTLAEVPTVIGELTTSAGDALHVDGITFSNSDLAPLKTAARRSAMEDARLRAEQLAESAGIRLGEVLNIAEVDDPGTRWFGRTMSAAGVRGAVPAMPVVPGDHSVTVRVSVTYAVEPVM
jgi:uncharacterized protein YggE